MIGPKLDRPGYVLTEGALKALANQKRDLETCKLDLSVTQESYKVCSLEVQNGPAFWQHPVFAIAAPVAAFLLGALVVGATQSK